MDPDNCVPASVSKLAFKALGKRRLVIDLVENDVVNMDSSSSPPWKLCRSNNVPVAWRRRDRVGPEAAPANDGRAITLEEIVGSKLCPKQTPAGIVEFVAIVESLSTAMTLHWTSKKLTTLFVLLRGVRGERGVRESSKAIFEHRWDVDAPEGIKAFGEHMVALYDDRVASGDEPRSFLSHAEGLHSGLSGVHFLRALALDEQLALIDSLAEKLVPYWQKAAVHRIEPKDVLRCYEAFQNSKLVLYSTSDKTKKDSWNTNRSRKHIMS